MFSVTKQIYCHILNHSCKIIGQILKESTVIHKSITDFDSDRHNLTHNDLKNIIFWSGSEFHCGNCNSKSL